MKTPSLILSLVFSAVPIAVADPFSVRTLPAGFDAPVLGGGNGPRIMNPIAADFLGNGRLQWYQGGNIITRFPENGTLTLPSITLPQTPSATVVPLAATVADVDRDGDTDLIRINEWNGNAFEYTLQVFLNNGFGTFTAGPRVDWTNSLPYNEGTHYLTMLPADYNKDGRVDLAIIETYSSLRMDTDPIRWDGKIYIRWNDGVGGFSSTSTLQPGGIPTHCRITAADYDRDGDIDIFSTEYNTFGPASAIYPFEPTWEKNRSLLYTNDGTGTFSTGSNFAGLMPRTLVDLNGDGWADLADGAKKALNNGSGAFGSIQNLTVGGGVWSSVPNIFADLSGDGLPELLFVEGAAVSYNPNVDGKISSASWSVATLPAEVDGMAAADSDEDGDIDIFVSMKNGTFAFLENREPHTVPGARLAASLNLNGVTSLKSADFNLDGQDDLLAVTPSQESMWFIHGQSDGLPGTPGVKLTQGDAAHSAVVADFDRDGAPDVAYTVPAKNAVYLSRNSGGIWADSAIATGLPGVSLLAAGEYGTPDGRPDLFTCSSTTGQMRGLYQTGVSWNGQNIFSPVSPAPQALAVGQNTTAPGDEVAFLSSGTSSLSLRGAQLSGGWVPLGGAGVSQSVSGGPYAAKLIWADMTGDKTKEAVYINGAGYLASWMTSANISQTYGAPPAALRDLAAVDWDCDGRNDILAATASGLTLYHYRRGGQGWTYTNLYAPASGGYTSVVTLDLNHDGRPDAAAANSSTGRIDYIYNEPYNLQADLADVPAEVKLAVGKTADAFVLPLSSNGRPAESNGLVDPSFAITRFQISFSQAVAGPGGTWVPGADLTPGTLTGLVSSVSLFANGIPVVTSNAGDLNAAGLFLDYNANFGDVAPIAPATTVDYSLRISVPPTALQQAAPRFFVQVESLMAEKLTGQSLYPNAGEPTLFLNNHPVLVTIVPDYTPLQAWRADHFGSPNSTGTGANNADYDGDGVPNLVEYLTGTNPVTGETATNTLRSLTILPLANSLTPVRLRLILSTAAMADPKVKVTIQWSSNPGNWATFATRTGGGSWTGSAAPQGILTDGGTTTTHLFATGLTPAAASRYFFRLKVEELP